MSFTRSESVPLPKPPMGNEHSGKLTNIGIVSPFVRGHSCALILY
jgi:hypothetical protein